MNLGEKKELTEPTIPCKQESANVVPVDHSVDVSRIDVPQHEADLTTTICDEQAKADIYLPDEIDDASKKKIKCPACEQRCTKRSNLRRHIRRFHEGNGDLLKQVSADYCVACLLCEQKFSHIVYLKSHLTKTHAVEFDEQEYFFPSSNEFLEWKTELERQTDSVYIKQTGEVRRKDGISYSYFKCNRSGNYRPKIPPSNRKRRMKAYGTVKMNSHCTSVMKLIHGMNGEVNVHFCATHYGHDGFNECRETMLQNSFINSKHSKKIEGSKMIGSLDIPLNKETVSNMDPKYLHETVSSSLSSDPMVSIIVETSNCKFDGKNAFLICDKPFSSPQITLEDNGAKPPDFEDDRNLVGNPHITTDYPCSSPNSSVEDTEEQETFKLPSQNCHPTAKRKLVSNLQKLICVIENCQSEEILDLVANGVEELVNKFTPLVENQHTNENLSFLFDNS